MFEDVAQMEKEIETFRKNIAASSELVEGILQLTEVTRQQKEAMDASTEELVKKIDSCILQIKKDNDAALKELGSSNESALSMLEGNMAAQQNRIAADFQARVAEIDKIRGSLAAIQDEAAKQSEEKLSHLTAECERLISEMKAVIGEQQIIYTAKLSQTESAIKDYQEDAEKKYKDFIYRLETTNVDQLFRELQDLKKSIQFKFVILISGIGAALAAAILGIVIR